MCGSNKASATLAMHSSALIRFQYRVSMKVACNPMISVQVGHRYIFILPPYCPFTNACSSNRILPRTSELTEGSERGAALDNYIR